MSLFRRSERRSVSYQDVWASGGPVDLFGSSTVGALSLVPLFAAHRTIIDAVSSTPLRGYRSGTDGVSQRLPSPPPILTSPYGLPPFAWRAQCVSSLVSDGNAFGLVTSLGSDGWPSGLVWLDPRRVSVESDDANVPPVWLLEGRPIDPASLIHIPWIVPAGKWRGLSPLKAFMRSFELGAAAQQMGRDWFVNGAMPSGHLKSANVLSPSQADETKKKWKAAIQGRDVFVSGSDWTFDTIGVPADEARFIETLKLTATQVASIYGIPPEEIGGETGAPMTYSTVEGNERRLANRVVRPWAVRIEDALSLAMPRPSFVEFDLDATVRADLLSRMQAHEIALRSGVELLDEARISENRAPLTPEQLAQWANTHARQAAAPPQQDPTKGKP